jgi:membrane protease YdiL (CAAX protease family)
LSAARFLYDPQGKLRAPWRLVAFAIAAVLAYAALGLVAYPLVALAAGWIGASAALEGPLLVGALLIAHAVVLKAFERPRSWSFVWMGEEATAPRPLLVGALMGMLAIGVPSLGLMAVGWLRMEPAGGGRWIDVAWQSAMMLLPAAFAEELVVRGYPMAVLREAVGWPLALMGTSVAFGLLHLWNPGATVMSMVLVTLAGVFLGALVLVTRSLYAATLAHFAWNWVMAGLLHAPVSGLDEFAPAGYRLTDAGPDWATGGRWGPEGGIGAAVGMSVGLWYLFARAGGRALMTWHESREER